MILKLWDIEDIIDEAVAYLKDGTSGINAAITAINAAKSAKDTSAGRVVMSLAKFQDIAGNFTLKENENLFFFMVEETPASDPILKVSLPLWNTDSLGANVVNVSFEIIIEDMSDGTDPKRKLLRYITALRACLSDFLNDATIAQASRLTNVAPDFAQALADNNSQSYYSAGVNLEISFA